MTDIMQLVGSVEGVVAKDADDDTEESKAPVPTPGQVMPLICCGSLLEHMTGRKTCWIHFRLLKSPSGRCLHSKQRSPTSLLGNKFAVPCGPYC